MTVFHGRSEGPSEDEPDLHEVMPQSISPQIAERACRLMSRAEAMGLLTDVDSHLYSTDLLAATLEGFARHGIGRRLVSIVRAGEDLRRVLEALNEEVEQSPLPETEWPSMLRLFDRDTLSQFLGTSPSSIRRYTTGERHTPDALARRLHWLALVVADLSGAYNAYGIRRWFERPRRALSGKAPRAFLVSDWNVDQPEIQAIRRLAADLTAPFAA